MPRGLARCRASTPTEPPAAGQPVYLHVFDWPADGIVRVPAALGVSSARFLTGASIAVHPDGDGWLLQTGAKTAPDPLDTVIVLDA